MQTVLINLKPNVKGLSQAVVNEQIEQ